MSRSVNKIAGDIAKLFDRFGGKHAMWKLFQDYLLISSVSLSASYDFDYAQQREARFESTASEYTSEEMTLFAVIHSALIMGIEELIAAGHISDVLGPVFHIMELHSHWKGQFFTHRNITDFASLSIMGAIPEIDQYGYFRIAEPSCGSGAFILSQAQALRQEGYDHSTQMVVWCSDIDPICMMMCYLQLSLYGVAAVIYLGDGLAPQPEPVEVWRTPLYMIYGWQWWDYTDYSQAKTREAYIQKIGNPDLHWTPVTISILCEQLRRLKRNDKYNKKSTDSHG